MSYLFKPLTISFRLLYALLIATPIFVVTFNMYCFVRLGKPYFKGLMLTLKHTLSNPLVSNIDTWHYLYVNYSNYQKDGMIPLIIIGTLSLFIGLVFAFSQKMKKKQSVNNDKVIRGSRLISAKELQREIKNLSRNEVSEILKSSTNRRLSSSNKSKLKKELQEQDKKSKFQCASLDDKLYLPHSVQVLHDLVIGSSGAGKSTQMLHRIEHCNKNGYKNLVLDINGELYSKIGREEDIILSPYDKRTYKWDFDKELRDGVALDAHYYSSYFVEKGSEKNKFFWKGGRAVFEELLRNNFNSEKLFNSANNIDEDLAEHLSGIVQRVTGQQDTTQSQGVIGSTVLELKALKYIIDMNIHSKKEYFSISEWAKNETNRNLFIIVSYGDVERFRTLTSIWTNIAINSRLRTIEGAKIPRLKIHLDELQKLGRIELLSDAAQLGRKYGLELSLSLQSPTRCKSIYLDSDWGNIESNIGTRFIYNLENYEDCEYMSKILGKAEVVVKNKSENIDSQGKKTTSYSESISYKDTVLPSELPKLPSGHFYLKAKGCNPCLLQNDKKYWQSISEKHETANIEHLFKGEFEMENDEIKENDNFDEKEINTQLEEEFFISENYEDTQEQI